MPMDLHKPEGLSDRLLEDRLYEMTILEIESGTLDKSAEARALEEAEGDETKAKALYIKHRVRRLRDLFAEQNSLNQYDEEQQEQAKRKQNLSDAEHAYKTTTAFMSAFEKTMYDFGRRLKKW